MKFEDSFHVPVALPVAWDALTDIGRVYTCLPGAQLTEISENEFHGLVTLKLGPITASYKGTARFESLDRDSAKLVIHAEGRDRHGQGTAKARVYATLIPEGGSETRVDMVNEIDITGKAAQFGRSILTDVSREIMTQFAANLRQTLAAPQNGAGGSVEAEQTRTETSAAAPALDAGSLITTIGLRQLSQRPLQAAVLLGASLGLVFLIVRAFGRRRSDD